MKHTPEQIADLIGALNLSGDDWDATPTAVQEALAKLSDDRAAMLAALEAAYDALGKHSMWRVSTLRLDVIRPAIAKAKGAA